MKRIVLAIVALSAFAASAFGDVRIYEYTLFGGGNTDSTEQASAWIPVRGAKRIYIRTSTTRAAVGAYAATDADSAFSDSLISFRVLLSDSICCTVVGQDGRSHSSAADSIMLPVTAAGDTAKAMAGAMPLPVNKLLRAPSSGSGIITVVYPTKPGAATTAGEIDIEGAISKGFLRIRCTPLRRSTPNTWDATVPTRANGLKGFKMTAIVVTEKQ